MSEFQTLLSPKEAAKALGVSEDTLRQFVFSGELAFINVGTGTRRIRRMYDPADLARFRDRRGQAETPAQARAQKLSPTGGQVIGFRARQRQSPSGKLSR